VPPTELPPIRHNLAPGPSSLLPGLPEAARHFLASGQGGLNHRSAEFSALVRETEEALRRYLALPSSWRVYFVSSGTYAMELVLRNTCVRRCASLSAGAFGQRFATVARNIGRHVDEWQLPTGTSLPSWLADHGTDALAARLNSAAWQWSEAWLLCHNETAAGTALPLELLPPLEEGAPLRLVDGVSSIGAQCLPWQQADVCFFGVQKAFGCPPGLAVLLVGPRALAQGLALDARGRDTGAWFSFQRLEDNSRRHQASCTPNTLGMALLRHALRHLEAEGLTHWESHCRDLRDRTLSWLEAHPVVEPAVPRAEDRSLTVTAMVRRDGAPLLETQQALRRRGILIGGGYGEWKERSLRLAHFPAHTSAQLDEVLMCLDEVLTEKGVPCTP